jgi:hypothetical protein
MRKHEQWKNNSLSSEFNSTINDKINKSATASKEDNNPPSSIMAVAATTTDKQREREKERERERERKGERERDKGRDERERKGERERDWCNVSIWHNTFVFVFVVALVCFVLVWCVIF